MASELTRAQLQAAVDDFDARGTMADYRHLHFLAQAGRELLAMQPATAQEVVAAANERGFKFGTQKLAFVAGWNANGKRLLPFPGDPAAPAPTETR